jgi:hypothetical protein
MKYAYLNGITDGQEVPSTNIVSNYKDSKIPTLCGIIISKGDYNPTRMAKLGFTEILKGSPVDDSLYITSTLIRRSGDTAVEEYTTQTKNLDPIKTQKKQQISGYYENLTIEGFTHDGKDYDGKIETVGGIEAKVNKQQRGSNSSRNISGVNLTNPAVVVAPGSQFADGTEIYISGITGTTELNGHVYSITRSGNNLTLYDETGSPVDGSTMTAWVSGGTVQVGFRWIAKDNSKIEISFDDAKLLSDAAIEFQTQMKWKSRNHKDAVDALSTYSEIVNYDYTTT